VASSPAFLSKPLFVRIFVANPRPSKLADNTGISAMTRFRSGIPPISVVSYRPILAMNEGKVFALYNLQKEI